MVEAAVLLELKLLRLGKSLAGDVSFRALDISLVIWSAINRELFSEVLRNRVLRAMDALKIRK
jgi:hypothetical protein